MSLGGNLKMLVNRGLRPLGLRVESTRGEEAAASRLADLARSGHFAAPAFPVLKSFEACDPAALIEMAVSLTSDLRRLSEDRSDLGFRFANDYFTSPDAEIAYVVLRWAKPVRVIEIGSGNSTRLFRAAIRDGGLSTELVSIDPDPRTEVAGVADRVLRSRFEDLEEKLMVDLLEPGSILFIDSSHRVEAANDVVRLLLRILPSIPVGVLVHLHDIFLPFDYPREWIVDLGWLWNEQYLVQALLQGSSDFEVIWPGHYLQRYRPELAARLPFLGKGRASSLWLRRSGASS